jgi:hypothetical protein
MPGSRDTVFLSKQIQTKKNNLNFNEVEFFSGLCLGSCPVQAFKIGTDSIMYHYGYRNTKHTGLSKYKLNPAEFSRIQKKLNAIDTCDFNLCVAAPDRTNFKIFLKTPNDSIETNGMFCSNNEDFNSFIVYLEFLERFLNLDPIVDQNISFRYNPNYSN